MRSIFFKNLEVILIGIFMVLPVASNAAGSVLINEIAWMGTTANSADEWVELYNTTSSEIDLSGWGLYEGGGATLIISLSGKIQPSSYYLIERTDDNSVSSITADVFGPFVGSGLNNSGENLILKDSAGLVVDYIDASSGWPSGDNTLKASMERKTDGTWQTNNGITINGKDAGGGNIVGTPKAQNSSIGSEQTITTESSTGTNSSSGSGSGSGVSYSTSTPVVSLKAVAGLDVIAEVDQVIKFDASKSEGANSYKWYLGDGSVKEGIEINHSYNFSGTHLVTLEVSNGSEVSLDQVKVLIFGGKALISEVFVSGASTTPSWIEIFNPTKLTLDISGWLLESQDKKFIFPPFSIIVAGGYFVVSEQISNLSVKTGSVKLKYPSDLIMDEVVFENVQLGSSASRTSNGFFWTKEITPGSVNIVTSSGSALLENMKAVPNLVKQKEENTLARNYLASFYNQVEAFNVKTDELGKKEDEENSFWHKLGGGLLFWLAVVMAVGLVFGVGYIRLVRKNQ